MSRMKSVMVVAVFFLQQGNAQGAKVKVWHHYQPSHFEKAQIKNAVVSSEGVLRLSRQLKPLAVLEAAHVWDVVEDRAGNLFVATGDQGKIYKVTADGKASVIYKSEDSHVFCLALSKDGTLYAGTGPGGLILRITENGRQILHKTGESYVWSLAVEPQSQLVYAGTGPKGKILRVTPQGEGRLFYATKQDHILSLAAADDGTLYAGTDKDGLVYRISPQGKGFVVYSAPQSEIRSLLVTADGLYAGTSSPSRRRGGSGGPSGGSRASGSVPLGGGASSASVESPKPKTAVAETKLASSGSSSSDISEKSNPAAAPSSPAGGENSLYRISPDGTVRELFREKTLVLSLLKRNGRILIGTGTDGQLFEVDETSKERSEIARLEHGQIHCLCSRQDGSIVIGTGDPGKLYVIQDQFVAKGTVISDVLDAKMISKWGSQRWTAETPAQTGISLASRSGNTPVPDDTWSEWSAEQTDAAQATIAAPTARFLQYRVTMSTDNPAVSPGLKSLAIRYQNTNQAPEISSITVPNLDAVNLDNPKKLRFKWAATDANDRKALPRDVT